MHVSHNLILENNYAVEGPVQSEPKKFSLVPRDLLCAAFDSRDFSFYVHGINISV